LVDWPDPGYATPTAVSSAERVVRRLIPEWRREANDREIDGRLDPVDARYGWDLLAADLRNWRQSLASALGTGH
jgi:hypothetical protein